MHKVTATPAALIPFHRGEILGVNAAVPLEERAIEIDRQEPVPHSRVVPPPRLDSASGECKLAP